MFSLIFCLSDDQAKPSITLFFVVVFQVQQTTQVQVKGHYRIVRLVLLPAAVPFVVVKRNGE